MSRVSLNKDLEPKDKVTFRLEVTLFGEEVDDMFDMVVPRAAVLMSTQKNIRMKAEDREKYIPQTGPGKNYNFSKYRISNNNIGSNKYRLLTVLNNEKKAGELEVGDEVLVTCANLTQVPAVVVAGASKRKKYVYLAISKSQTISPSSNTAGNANGTFAEVKKIKKIRKITIELNKSVLDDLMAKKVGNSLSKGNVEDILIFAYKQFNGVNKSSIKYKLMNNDAIINLKNPPQHSAVVEWRRKTTAEKDFTINDEEGNKVLCYVAIARYIYDGTKWNGEWLQTDKDGDVIWGQAK